jgi:hypothetical protein
MTINMIDQPSRALIAGTRLCETITGNRKMRPGTISWKKTALGELVRRRSQRMTVFPATTSGRTNTLQAMEGSRAVAMAAITHTAARDSRSFMSALLDALAVPRDRGCKYTLIEDAKSLPAILTAEAV